MTSISNFSSSDDETPDEPMDEATLQKWTWNDNIYKEEMSYYSRTKVLQLEIYFKWNGEANLEKASRNAKHDKFDDFERQMFDHKSEDANLYSCLEANQTSELLSKDNSWYCKKC